MRAHSLMTSKPARGRAIPVIAAALTATLLAIAPARPESPMLVAAAPEGGTEIERFCSNIADAARDRRYALQAEELRTLQQEVDKRMKMLEEKRADYEAWMKRREAFIEMAQEGVVKIYAGMKPDAAAERMAELQPSLAAAILMKLDARRAGVILNEMDSKVAATLTGIMANAARRTDPS